MENKTTVAGLIAFLKDLNQDDLPVYIARTDGVGVTEYDSLDLTFDLVVADFMGKPELRIG